MGLVPAVAQEARGGRVLTVAWMNREALQQDGRRPARRTTGRARAESCGARARSPGTCRKCNPSGSIATQDVVLLEVEQAGGIACHTGRHSCFLPEARRRQVGRASIRSSSDPAEIYRGDTMTDARHTACVSGR